MNSENSRTWHLSFVAQPVALEGHHKHILVGAVITKDSGSFPENPRLPPQTMTEGLPLKDRYQDQQTGLCQTLLPQPRPRPDGLSLKPHKSTEGLLAV